MSEGAADVDGDGLIHTGLVLSECLLEVVVGAVVGPEGGGEVGGEEEGEEQSSLHLVEKLTADCQERGAHRSVWSVTVHCSLSQLLGSPVLIIENKIKTDPKWFSYTYRAVLVKVTDTDLNQRERREL